MMKNSFASFRVTHLRAAVAVYLSGIRREQTLNACLRKKWRGSVQSSIFLWIAHFCKGVHFKMIVRSPHDSLELTMTRKLDIYILAGKYWNQVFWLKIKLIPLFIGNY